MWWVLVCVFGGVTAELAGGQPSQPVAPSPTPAPTTPAQDPKTPPAPAKQPVPDKPADAVKGPKAPEPGEIKTAEDLLARLETADKDLRTLSAVIKYDLVAGAIEGGYRTSRRGTLDFTNRRTEGGEPNGSFAVRFTQLITDRKVREEDQTFIYHDGVAVERLGKDKQITRFKLSGKDRKVNLLKIGEGPFPIPFGQKSADILARFDVQLLPATDGIPAERHGDVLYEDGYQLRLVPKANVKAAKEFTEARMWFTRENLTPFMARTTKQDGGSEELMLINIRRNEPIEDKVFDTTTPSGWSEEEKELG